MSPGGSKSTVTAGLVCIQLCGSMDDNPMVLDSPPGLSSPTGSQRGEEGGVSPSGASATLQLPNGIAPAAHHRETGAALRDSPDARARRELRWRGCSSDSESVEHGTEGVPHCPTFASLETVSTASVLTPTHARRGESGVLRALPQPSPSPPATSTPSPQEPRKGRKGSRLAADLALPPPAAAGLGQHSPPTPPARAAARSPAAGCGTDHVGCVLPRLGSLTDDLPRRTLHPSSLNQFKHKVSGHHLMFRTADGKIAKESTHAEERFYTLLRCSARRSPEAQQFNSFIAGFEGVGYVPPREQAEQRCAAGDAPSTSPAFPADPLLSPCGAAARQHPADRPRAGEPEGAPRVPCEGRKFILLRDLTYGFNRPCIVDMKMGVRNYGLGCSLSKRASKKRKTQETTSASLGMRLHGMKKWDAGRQEYVLMDKHTGRELCQDTLLRSLRDFFLGAEGGLVLPALQHITERVGQLIRVFERQEVFHFYTSSLLLLYDWEAPGQTADICMIDFAHTYPACEVLRAEPAKHMALRDEGYLLGLRNLHRLLQALATGRPFAPLPPTITSSGRPATAAAQPTAAGADGGCCLFPSAAAGA